MFSLVFLVVKSPANIVFMRLFISLTFFFFLLVNIYAQAPKEKALLWKITGNGLKHPSYLYGTIHLMCADQIKIDSTLKQCFTSTQQLFLEVDMNDPLLMVKTMQHSLMKDNESLEHLVSKSDYDSMKTIFEKNSSMPFGLMGKVKPIMLMSAVFPSLLGCSPEAWETAFQNLAKEKNIPLKGLETIDFQMSVLDTIPTKTQAIMLKEFLYHLDSTKKSFNELLTIYKSKDINELHEMTVKDPDFSNYEAVMLDNRNKNWLQIISKEIKQKSSFFAVGAAHLGGESGEISLLKKQGFIVSAVE